MRFSVVHETHYGYSAPVTLSTHLLRFLPRPEAGQLIASRLVIEPEPRLVREIADRWGNRVSEVTFNGATDKLRIESRFEVETGMPELPITADLPLLPWLSAGQDGVAAFIAFDEPGPTVRSFAVELAEASGWTAPAFLERLNSELFGSFDRKIRFDGEARSAAQTLATRQGACRDLAVLFMAACRSVGIASRFVSGYQALHDSADGQRHLHAWPEAYVPGAGWLGFDPTHGARVVDGHVAISAAPRQSATMPVEGGFYGNDVTSTLSYSVQIEAR